MKTLRPVILATALLSVASFAQNAAAPAPAAPVIPEFKSLAGPIELKNGDSFVFLGDSITHQCLYTQYVEDFYYTRFPKTRIHFHNAGVGGDRATEALRRFDDDVASYKPKYISILLGMNDGSYTKFDQGIFDKYQGDMTVLLDRIEGIGAKAIPMTPTMHDSRAARLRGKPQEPRDTYYNSTLSYYGTWLREMAHQRGLGFVDMWTPLNSLTQAQRRKVPAFTLIKDAVHPDAPGQLVMASAFINDMARKVPVSVITIDHADGKLTSSARNGKVTELAGGIDGVSFTFAANALPWVVPPEAAEGYTLTRAGHRFSAEKLTARNLKPGKYELRIDGASVGEFTAVQLAAGLELQENTKTPQYQQALRVATLNKQRNDEAMRPLRNLWGKRKGQDGSLRQAESKKGDDLEAKREAHRKFLEEFKPQTEALIAKARELENQIYTENQPKPRKYELVAVSAK